MDNTDNVLMYYRSEAAPPRRNEDQSASPPCPGLPPEALAPRLAELKRQIAWRQAMA